MSNLNDRLDLAEKKIKEHKFRENRGLGNEVGYYIFDYPAEEEMYVRERINYIQKRNENSGDFELLTKEEAFKQEIFGKVLLH